MRLVLASVLLLAIAGTVVADSWAPYADRLVADPTGTYGVLVTANFLGPAKYVFFRRGADSPPIDSRLETDIDAKTGKPVSMAIAGHEVLKRGRLVDAPVHVRVSSEGLGFAAFDSYGRLGSGKAVVAVAADGTVHFEKTLPELFPDHLDQFPRTASSTWWHRGCWIDDERRQVVVIAGGGLFGVAPVGKPIVRVIDFVTGQTREGTFDDVRRGLEMPEPKARQVALDILFDGSLPGGRDSGEPGSGGQDSGGQESAVVGLFEDNGAALATRLRAGVLLAHRGDPRAAELFRKHGLAERSAGITDEDRDYAVTHSTRVLGLGALPPMLALLRDGSERVGWGASQRALRHLGSKAVPALIEIAVSATETANGRYGATHALGEIGDEAAIPGLLKVVERDEQKFASGALNALIAIGGNSVATSLSDILGRSSSQNSRIVEYFTRVRSAKALPALERYRASFTDDVMETAYVKQIDAAIAFQRESSTDR